MSINHGTSSSSPLTNSNCVLILTNKNIQIQLFYSYVLFYHYIIYYSASLCTSFGWIYSKFGYAPPQKLKIDLIFEELMYWCCRTHVVLLIYNLLILVIFFLRFKYNWKLITLENKKLLVNVKNFSFKITKLEPVMKNTTVSVCLWASQ